MAIAAMNYGVATNVSFVFKFGSDRTGFDFYLVRAAPYRRSWTCKSTNRFGRGIILQIVKHFHFSRQKRKSIPSRQVQSIEPIFAFIASVCFRESADAALELKLRLGRPSSALDRTPTRR